MIARTGVGPGGRPLVGAGLRAAQLQEDEQYLFKGTGAEQVPSVELVSPAILFHGRECHVAAMEHCDDKGRETCGERGHGAF